MFRELQGRKLVDRFRLGRSQKKAYYGASFATDFECFLLVHCDVKGDTEGFLCWAIEYVSGAALAELASRGVFKCGAVCIFGFFVKFYVD